MPLDIDGMGIAEMDSFADRDDRQGYGIDANAGLLDAVATGSLADLIAYASTGPGADPYPSDDYLRELLDDAAQEVDDFGVDSPEVVAGIEAIRAGLAALAALPVAA